ncbi:uncharacterized protein CMU_011390 [Cryptosporidium muris RN66]|uniref:Uncharacterized protein n=1 Tax=Cryptosporidium muris (strain RN66) TaxID=441375 RepID=B6AIZ9_CRYMR|nr:uncharacterized protein CMU_011390 [Cryptosporidium muris RN66]EEA08190.1 hypothetical protein CMU_011390 [Cryptosporidium muris RN66]|eukprot:XP_002142539.1 hypothetical protein [Cryptosporidium muris RN66]
MYRSAIFKICNAKLKVACEQKIFSLFPRNISTNNTGSKKLFVFASVHIAAFLSCICWFKYRIKTQIDIETSNKELTSNSNKLTTKINQRTSSGIIIIIQKDNLVCIKVPITNKTNTHDQLTSLVKINPLHKFLKIYFKQKYQEDLVYEDHFSSIYMPLPIHLINTMLNSKILVLLSDDKYNHVILNGNISQLDIKAKANLWSNLWDYMIPGSISDPNYGIFKFEILNATMQFCSSSGDTYWKQACIQKSSN